MIPITLFTLFRVDIPRESSSLLVHEILAHVLRIGELINTLSQQFCVVTDSQAHTVTDSNTL